MAPKVWGILSAAASISETLVFLWLSSYLFLFFSSQCLGASALKASCSGSSKFILEEGTPAAVAAAAAAAAGFNRSHFPPGFLFGSASSAYQVEGAAKEGCKGQSTWDFFTHRFPEMVVDKSTGDMATDSYHHYKEDIGYLKQMGMDAYRFSISWTRILPNGSLSGGVCKEGIDYYNNFIDAVIEEGLQPIITIMHVDYPHSVLYEYQGFLSKRIIKDFLDLADICFKEFGDRVKHWITFNEPSLFSQTGYSRGILPPLRCSSTKTKKCFFGDSATEPYIIGHNILLAHAAIVQLYRDKYQGYQKGQIGIVLASQWYEPFSPTKPDKEAVLRALDFTLGWFLDPITQGDYPFIMRALVGERLPRFSQNQTDLIKGSFDFIGINYYTSSYAQSVSPLRPSSRESYEDDSCTSFFDLWNAKPIDALAGSIYAPGIRDLLLYIKEKYNNPVIYVTENGHKEKIASHDSLEEALQDDKRIEYHSDHLYCLHEAITSGANVKGYIVWSLLDSFEWNSGYTRGYGIIHVDRKHEFKRHPKKSFNWFQKFLTNFTELQVPSHKRTI